MISRDLWFCFLISYSWWINIFWWCACFQVRWSLVIRLLIVSNRYVCLDVLASLLRIRISGCFYYWYLAFFIINHSYSCFLISFLLPFSSIEIGWLLLFYFSQKYYGFWVHWLSFASGWCTVWPARLLNTANRRYFDRLAGNYELMVFWRSAFVGGHWWRRSEGDRSDAIDDFWLVGIDAIIRELFGWISFLSNNKL